MSNYQSSELPQLYLYVLHSRPYRDTSAIITSFSAEMGKVTFIAKGIRAKKQAKIALLQPFTPIQAQLYGRNELKNLSKLEALGVALPMHDAFLYSGMYLNELLVRTLPAELIQPELFAVYERSIRALANEQPLEPLLRDFEFCLLQELGYGIEFTVEQSSGELIELDNYYAFDAQEGFIKVAPNSRRAIIGQVLQDIEQRRWNAQTLAVAKFITRTALRVIVGHRPLKSRELFSQKRS